MLFRSASLKPERGIVDASRKEQGVQYLGSGVKVGGFERRRVGLGARVVDEGSQDDWTGRFVPSSSILRMGS